MIARLLIVLFITAAVNEKVMPQAGKQAKKITELNNGTIKKGTGTIAITGANIIDGTGAAPLQDGIVIVRDGIITEVGSSGKIKVPAGASVYNAQGKTLLPGFIDSHFHLDENPGLPGKFLNNGVTSLRDPGLWIEVYDGERKSNQPLPRLFLTGPHIDMFPPAYPNDAYVVRDAAEAINMVNKLADQGSTAIKVYFRLPPSIIAEVCKAAHSRGLPVTAHLETTEAMEAITAGVDGIEHITSLGLSLVPKIKAEKYRQAVLADNNARKQGRYDVWSRIDLNGKLTDSLAKFLKKKNTYISSTLAVFEYQAPSPGSGQQLDTAKLNGFNKMKLLAGVLKKYGVRMVVGSHSQVPYAEKGWAFHREMELLNEGGMSNAEVLVAATMENARFFRIDERLGSIEKGKIADLQIINGDPIKNISDCRKIEKVMLNGVWIK